MFILSLEIDVVERHQAYELLVQMEGQLKALNLWQQRYPALEALASREPFCADTLSFEQWLQFVLIPRMSALLAGGHDLPTTIAVAPMAEQALAPLGPAADDLIATIGAFDALLSGG